jgi:hypothetical protein
MATITGSLTFTVGDSVPVETTTAEIKPAAILAVTTGNPAKTTLDQLRRLTYPGGLFAPIIYESNPDMYTNFNTSPLDKRPRAFATATLTDNILIGWQGVSKDVPIKEVWNGSSTVSRVTLDFFLALQDYYANPPSAGQYIQWEPRDRTSKKYNILIETLTLSVTGSAGQGVGDFDFDYIATRWGYCAGTMELTFRIISEA